MRLCNHVTHIAIVIVNESFHKENEIIEINFEATICYRFAIKSNSKRVH